VTEVTERVDNALKVTDDVYWNRLSMAMRESALRQIRWKPDGLDHLAFGGASSVWTEDASPE
jgi:hypothetical protein